MQTSAPSAVSVAPSPASAQDAGSSTLDPGKPGAGPTDGPVDAFTQALAAMMGLAGAPSTPTPATTPATAGGGQAVDTTPAPGRGFAANLPTLAAANANAAETLTQTPPAGSVAQPPAKPTVPDASSAANGVSSLTGKLIDGPTLANAQPQANDAEVLNPQTQPALADAANAASGPATALSADAAALALQPNTGPATKSPLSAPSSAKAAVKLDAANTSANPDSGPAANGADRPVAAITPQQNSQDPAEGVGQNLRNSTNGSAHAAEPQHTANNDNSNLSALTAQAGATSQIPTQAAANAAGAAGGAIVSQLATQVAKNVDGKSTRFDVALDPAGLGHVDVRVQIDAQGQVTAQFSFDNPHAAAEAKSQAGQLQHALEQAGFNVGQGGLSFDVGGQGAGLARQDSPPQAQQTTTAISTPDLFTAPAIAAAVWSRPSSGVDITI